MSRYAQNAVTHLTQIIKLEFDNIMRQSRYAQNTVTTSRHIQPEHNSMPMQRSKGKKLTLCQRHVLALRSRHSEAEVESRLRESGHSLEESRPLVVSLIFTSDRDW